MKVSDLDFDFAELVDCAMGEASTGWAMDFCANIARKYQRYGDEMFISDAQIAKLRQIAKDE